MPSPGDPGGARRVGVGTDDFQRYLQNVCQDFRDRCTRCGKCFEVCPIVEFTSAQDRKPEEVTAAVCAFLGGGDLLPEVASWAERCTGSARCNQACPEGLNFRLAIGIVNTRVKALKASVEPTTVPNYYKRMSQTVRLLVGLQVPPETLAGIAAGRARAQASAEIVLYLGCNVLRNPNIFLAAMDVFDALGFDYAVLGGVANCCGVVHFKMQGDISGSDVLASGTLEKLRGFNPGTVVTWCPTCQLHFTETRGGYAQYPFEIIHISNFLARHLRLLRPRLVAPINKRVALHEHAGVPGVAESVRAVLSAIPGLTLVEVPKAASVAYTCGPGALGLIPALQQQVYGELLEGCRAQGIDLLVDLYHTCHRLLCGVEREYSFEITNWIPLVATAMGLEPHADLFRRYKSYGDVERVLEEAKELVAQHRLDPDEVREFLYAMMDT